MALSYAQIQDRIEQLIQDTSNVTYDTTELGMWIEDELKRISISYPLVIEVIFKVESRCGTDVTGTASSLTDSVKGQFLAADATNEKVVHNTTDDTWAVVTGYTSANVLTISRNIMAANENYEIYNKRCKNKRQIFIGDMPKFLWVDSVEYPIGQPRNFSLPQEDILELEVYDNTVYDSDTTLSNLNPVDVLVRFAVPQLLSQLTDWAGEVDLVAGYAEGDTTIHVDGLAATETIEIGEQFHLENHRSVYTITTATTLASNEGDITFYPGLEATLANDDNIDFRKSTLTQKLEEILCQRVAARAMLSNTVTHLNAATAGGAATYQKERQWAMDILMETTRGLRSGIRAKPYSTLPRS